MTFTYSEPFADWETNSVSELTVRCACTYRGQERSGHHRPQEGKDAILEAIETGQDCPVEDLELLEHRFRFHLDAGDKTSRPQRAL